MSRYADDLKLAFVTGGYSAVALNNAAVSLVGISGFTLNVANLDVLFNGAPAASRLDWTAIPELAGYDGLVSTLSFKVAGDVGLSSPAIWSSLRVRSRWRSSISARAPTGP